MNLYKAVIKRNYRADKVVYVPAKSYKQAEKRIKKVTFIDPESIEIVCKTYEDHRGGLIYD